MDICYYEIEQDSCDWSYGVFYEFTFDGLRKCCLTHAVETEMRGKTVRSQPTEQQLTAWRLWNRSNIGSN